MLKRRLTTVLFGVAAALVIAGGAATIFWLLASGVEPFAVRHWGALLGCLVMTAALTLCNLGLRWMRWHFLMRRFGVRVPARDSLRLYGMTLPAIATPFYLGEWLRAPLLLRRHNGAPRAVAMTWLVERGTDCCVLLVFFFAAKQIWFAVGLVALGWLLLIGAVQAAARPWRLFSPALLAALALCSLVAWLLPVLALHLTLQVIFLREFAVPSGAVLSGAEAMRAFAAGTLTGGATGIPLGTGVTGSAAILDLQKSGVSRDGASLAIALLRAGTAWFALGLGALAIVRWHGFLREWLRPSRGVDHFDEISSSYENQIPAHIRARLLARKVDFMQRSLDKAGIHDPTRGLDIGCGQGWYAVEMQRLGHAMIGMDSSVDQLRAAHAYAADNGSDLSFVVADAAALPFKDNTFDFIYSVNVLHHIADPQTQSLVFQEIRRLLKPGGVFFLHEINTDNPFFRLYMGYLFPLLCDIDEGTEWWIRPSSLPAVGGAQWDREINYFTFLPDFTPPLILHSLQGFEAALERSRLRGWSAHYMARLVKPR